MKKNKNIIVIAGTIDARELIGKLLNNGFNVISTVTTNFGKSLIEPKECLKVYEGKLSVEGMRLLIRAEDAKFIVDASHPFAVEVSRNAIQASKEEGICYIRYEREKACLDYAGIVKVRDFEVASNVISKMEGNIFLTIGSNNLGIFTQNIHNYKERLFVRVLPESDVISKCESLGLNSKNIIALKGPFTKNMNKEMIKYCNAKVIVTKDSGQRGGVIEKIEVAKDMGLPLILIERPLVEYLNLVYSFDEVIDCIGRLEY